MITEAKLDDRFPIGQLFINSFSSPFRLDLDRNGGGTLLYIREDIPSKRLYIEKEIEASEIIILPSMITCYFSPKFCLVYSLTSMINKPTCYKKPEKPSCIDLILIHCPRS